MFRCADDAPSGGIIGAAVSASVHYIRRESGRRHEIRSAMGPGLNEVMAAVKAQGIGPAGPWFTHQLKMDPATIDVSLGLSELARALTNSENRKQRRGERAERGCGTEAGLAGRPRSGRNGETNGDGSYSKDYGKAKGAGRQPTGRQIGGIRQFGSCGRTRTYNPSVNSRVLYH